MIRIKEWFIRKFWWIKFKKIEKKDFGRCVHCDGYPTCVYYAPYCPCDDEHQLENRWKNSSKN
jgi:hypothetical protein